jgi:hypothetical protein
MKTSRRGRVAKSASGLDVDQALLAQILIQVMGDAGQQKKALALRNSGLTNADIAGLMGTSPEVIGTVLYQARKRGVSKKKKTTKGKRADR